MSDQDDFDLELEGVDDDLEIQVEDDTPPEDRGKTPIPDEDDDDDEIADVSERVKQRIAKLTKQRHDERRAKEALERELQQAAITARTLFDKTRQYEQAMAQYEKFGVDQAKGRVEIELEQAKQSFKDAFERGDADAMAEAQATMARLAPQHEQFSRYQPRQVQPEPEPPIQRMPERDPRDTERFERWVRDNSWFNQDPDLTAFARGWHMMKAERDPQYVGTEAYYEEITGLVREKFPDRFQEKKRAAAPVSPPSRGKPSGDKPRTKVVLTESQVRLAKRLGITPQEYAKSLLAMENNQ